MKENKYDHSQFFDKYNQMQRSVKGLEGTGKWSALKSMLPDFKGKRVLDLGCGNALSFYTIVDGKIIHCGDYGRTSLSVNDEDGLIAYFGRMGGCHIDKITLEGSSIETTFIAGNYIEYAETYPELDELGYENYKYRTFCPPAIPLALYTYKQNISFY